MSELFPPIKIKNGALVGKDGYTVKHFEGVNYRIVNDRHESFPIPINEDSTIRLPTPKGMERMLDSGQTRQDLPLSSAVPWIGKAISLRQNLRPTVL